MLRCHPNRCFKASSRCDWHDVTGQPGESSSVQGMPFMLWDAGFDLGSTWGTKYAQLGSGTQKYTKASRVSLCFPPFLHILQLAQENHIPQNHLGVFAPKLKTNRIRKKKKNEKGVFEHIIPVLLTVKYLVHPQCRLYFVRLTVLHSKTLRRCVSGVRHFDRWRENKH